MAAKQPKWKKEYQRLYKNIKAKQKYWLDRGYDIDNKHKKEIEVVPYSKLNRTPSIGDIKRLRDINENRIYKYLKKEISDIHVGKKKEITLKEGIDKIRKEGGIKSAKTKKEKSESLGTETFTESSDIEYDITNYDESEEEFPSS